jgi:alcohol dehydrogenase, propanol-preferring
MSGVRACVLRSPGPIGAKPLEWCEVPSPEPGPGEVLVRVETCAVCRTDLHVVEGELPPRKSPVIPGHQVVGIVERSGPGAARFPAGTRVGAAWLRATCGHCRYCRSGRENLCERAEFNGWTADGGYAEYLAAPEAFLYPVPEGFSSRDAAPLLCAGIIGYRSLKLSGIRPGGKLGIYGFGAAAHVTIQVARFQGAEVYALTRQPGHRKLALELGAAWAGDPAETPPAPLDAAIIFAPAGELVPLALRALDKGGTLALGGIHMSPIPSLDYQLLYGERAIRSVANNTREDGEEFLRGAASIPVRTRVSAFPLEEANEALRQLKEGAVSGAAVLEVANRR